MNPMASTPRLILREWQEQDLAWFRQLNADPEVMRYFPATLSAEESDESARSMQALLRVQGWGFWAVELKRLGRFIGFVGLNKPGYRLPIFPCTEIGWRLDKDFWGQGYAFEAAQAALAFGFETLAVSEIVAFTALQNQRSRRLMERLGMVNTGLDFDHPMVPADSELQRHVLYKIGRDSLE